jgi:hypothetical protein
MKMEPVALMLLEGINAMLLIHPIIGLTRHCFFTHATVLTKSSLYANVAFNCIGLTPANIGMGTCTLSRWWEFKTKLIEVSATKEQDQANNYKQQHQQSHKVIIMSAHEP